MYSLFLEHCYKSKLKVCLFMCFSTWAKASTCLIQTDATTLLTKGDVQLLLRFGGYLDKKRSIIAT